ncbi:MAG TPA: DoxX family protein [Bacteroidia bacterium]|nr:DoxX family protein [Bacteroidia bacterium]
MNRTKLFYWITTSLFSAFMLFSAIPDILMVPEAMAFLKHLGYPVYFVPFIGLAKMLGSAAILIPAFRAIKEWAYAGLAYDLIGATYSVSLVDGIKAESLLILLPIALLFVSYKLNRKVYPVSES